MLNYILVNLITMIRKVIKTSRRRLKSRSLEKKDIIFLVVVQDDKENIYESQISS